MIAYRYCRALAAILVAAFVGNCTRQPTLRSIAFREFGPRSTVLDPVASLPGDGRRYARNNYAYVPGTLVAPLVENDRDLVRGLADRWNTVHQDIRFCPQHRFKLRQIALEKHKDIIDDYIMDQTLSFDPQTWANRSALRQSYSMLAENEIGRLKRVTFRLKNIRSYTLDQSQLYDAKEEIKRNGCFALLGGRSNLKQVARAYVGDIDLDIEYASGGRLGTDAARFHIERSNSFRRNAKSVLLAVIANEI
ncbi:hypothetical protein NLM27_24350 [Bradyrhizobium sp. CCGB12]|uniref:hypothetical protein n=1 Tax=Bradyrhizobium sp. CCGB12 TaxID=2949632 RepID=UPI0020B3E978|nr:hypothetical protein [Bradyrhizobium sp. CCGB12]MCP3391928.1 hypothetical protein [Bradyrhizobium sp. CCGB12]